MKRFNKFKKKLLKFSLLAAGLILFLYAGLLIALQKYRYVTYEIADRIQKHFFIPVPIDLKTNLWNFEKHKDRLEYWWFDYEEEIMNSGLDKYQFLIHDSTINYFKIGEENPVYENVKNKYFPIQCVYKEDTFNVEFKLHSGGFVSSDNPQHKYFKKSFKIKTSKENKINERSQWEFLIPEDRFFLGTYFAHQLDSKVGLPITECGFGVLKINDMFHGIYYIEEDIDEGEEYLKANDLEHCVFLKPENNSVLTNDINFHHAYPVKFKERSNLKKYENEIYKRLYELEQLLDKNEHEKIGEYLDFDKIAAIEAELFLRGNWGVHDIQEFGNSRWIYNTLTKKFFIAPRHETGFSELSEKYSPFSLSCIEKNLAHYNYYPGYHKVLYNTFRNDSCRFFINQNLSKLVIMGSILNLWDQKRKKIGELITRDITNHISLYDVNEIINEIEQALINNLKKIKAFYNNSSCLITFIKHSGNLEIVMAPYSYSFLDINTFKITTNSRNISTDIDLKPLFSKYYMACALDNQLYPMRKFYSVYQKTLVDEYEIENVEIKIINTFTGNELDKNQLFLNTIHAFE